MRQLSRVTLLVTVLLLAGCNSDFATLTFGDRVSDGLNYETGDRIKQVYHDEIGRLLKEVGIEDGAVRILENEDDSTRTSLILTTDRFGGISDEQKKQVVEALKKHIADRKETLGAIFTLQRDQMSQDMRRYALEDAANLDPEYSLRLKPDDVLIGTSYGLRDMFAAAMEGRKDATSEATCSVALKVLASTPFRSIDVASEDGSLAKVSLTRLYSSRYGIYRIPATVTLDQPELQTRLDNREIFLSTQLSNGAMSPLDKRPMSQVELFVGSLGEITHENAKVSYYEHAHLKQRCRDMAAGLGRPFSFTFGDSLDRLEAVAFSY